MAIEGGVGPVGGVVDGHDVLVRGEEQGLERVVCAIEGEDESESVDVVYAGVGVAGLC